MKFLKAIAAVLLLATILWVPESNSQINSAVTQRHLELVTTPDAYDFWIRDDARGTMTFKIWHDSAYGEPVPIDYWVDVVFDFKRLGCLGGFEVDLAWAAYGLYVNDQIIMVFNPTCKYGLPPEGWLSGSFGTKRIYVNAEQLEGWLDDPLNTPIHAKVKIVYGWWEGPVVLEGFLDGTP